MWQKGQEHLLWTSVAVEAANDAASDTEANSLQRGGPGGYTATPPPMHVRGTDLTLTCDVVLTGDICVTASHVVGRGLRNKGNAGKCHVAHEYSYVRRLQFRPFLCVSMLHSLLTPGAGDARVATVFLIPYLVNSLDQKLCFRKSSWTFRLPYLTVSQRVRRVLNVVPLVRFDLSLIIFRFFRFV